MVNIYSRIKDSAFRQIELNELLFVEHTHMIDDIPPGVWSRNNYFVFIRSGKMIWRSIYHSYEAVEGDILFIKKGANLMQQLTEEFSALYVFIPDELIKTFLKRNRYLLDGLQKDLSDQDTILRAHPDELLESYCRSIQSLLTLEENPCEPLLNLKLEELLLSLFANKRHAAITDYFLSLSQEQSYQISRIMDWNFAYNLKLEDYARMCHMSLSAFKKAFRDLYDTTPAVWLKRRKLALALHRVLTSHTPIGQIAFECGFEDSSNFIRLFKLKYELTPFQYRRKYQTVKVTCWD